MRGEEKERGGRKIEGRRERKRKRKGGGKKRKRRKRKRRGKKQIQGPTRELASLAPPRRGGQLCSATKNLKYPLLILDGGT